MYELSILLGCRRIEAEGVRGPGAAARLPYTLEGVSYRLAIEDPSAEPPFHIPDLWLYLRFHRLAAGAIVLDLALRVYAIAADGERSRVRYPADDPGTGPFELGRLQFPERSPAMSVPVRVSDLVLPRTGRYEFRIVARRSRPSWKGSEWRTLGWHYLAVEK